MTKTKHVTTLQVNIYTKSKNKAGKIIITLQKQPDIYSETLNDCTAYRCSTQLFILKNSYVEMENTW